MVYFIHNLVEEVQKKWILSFPSNPNVLSFILTSLQLKCSVLVEQMAYAVCLFSNVGKVEGGSVICLLYVGS